MFVRITLSSARRQSLRRGFSNGLEITEWLNYRRILAIRDAFNISLLYYSQRHTSLPSPKQPVPGEASTTQITCKVISPALSSSYLLHHSRRRRPQAAGGTLTSLWGSVCSFRLLRSESSKPTSVLYLRLAVLKLLGPWGRHIFLYKGVYILLKQGKRFQPDSTGLFAVTSPNCQKQMWFACRAVRGS